jgi:hypothetical protein
MKKKTVQSKTKTVLKHKKSMNLLDPLTKNLSSWVDTSVMLRQSVGLSRHKG